MDLKLDTATDDLALLDGDLVLADGLDAIAQDLRSRLRLFQGEWILDTAAGVPYYQDILKKNPNPQIVAGVLQNAILNTPGVLELLKFDLDFVTATRSLKIDFEVRAREGVINFSEILGV
jgi:hypothetical protein